MDDAENDMTKLIHGGDVYSAQNKNPSIKIVDFSANINPLGMPNEVKTAIVENIDSYECYPDPINRELTNAISKAMEVEPKYILCGNGAADLIFRLVYALKPKTALLLAPTFAEYEQALNVVECYINYHKLLSDNEFILDESILNVIDDKLDIVFICNPNNPTGKPTYGVLMQRIAEKCKECGVILIADECFIDFLENEEEFTLKKSLEGNSNIVIIRAFTKMYAMAGIRLGYIISSNQSILKKAYDAGQPWSVSTVASKCGVAAISCDSYVEQTRQQTTQNRLFLTKQLENLGFRVFISKANFILFYTESTFIKARLEEHGILIRSCANYRGLTDNYFRIAVKSKADNEYLIECLKKIIEKA